VDSHETFGMNAAKTRDISTPHRRGDVKWKKLEAHR